MNNAKLTENSLQEEEAVDTTPMLRSRQEKIAKIIEAIDSIANSNYWKFLQNEFFLGALDSAVNQICIEKDDRKIASLQGEIRILSKYADFKALSDAYRLELQHIERQLKGRN